jgi:ABC-type branched-subunit amino acid transport system substrate-binding protein
MRTRARPALLAAAAATAATVLLAACGSSKSSPPTTAGSAGPKQTITIGVISDETGPAASGNKTFIDGVKAGIVYAARNGYDVKFVDGDTATNPTAALAAVQKMVTQDHVFAVLAESALLFTTTNYLTAHNVPVVGMSEDGPEWISSKNMFSVAGPLQTTKVATTNGALFKMLGVDNIASIGYSVSPLSSEAASAFAASAQHAGIKVGYLNAKFPFGSTDVGPTVLQMKADGVNGLYATVDPDTGFALIKGYRNAGGDLKVALLPTGYGGDMLQAGPGALADAQDVYFAIGAEPVEMHTPATTQFEADLAASGSTGEPTYAMYNGYMSVGLLLQGLKAAGAGASQAGLIAGLGTIHAFNGLGLYGSHTVDINDRVNVIGGPDNCTYITKLVGSTFQLVKGADPICGTAIAGVTVQPAT